MDFDEIVETSDAEELEEIARKELESRNHVSRTPERLTPPPRKKVKYYHAQDREEEISTLTFIKDESIQMNSPERSQSSSTMFTGNTSPGPLFTSRSPTQSPGRPYGTQSLPKTEGEDVPMEFYSPPPQDSQDPLLLHSPIRPLPDSPPLASHLNDPSTMPLSIPQPTTPLHSPTRRRNDSLSPPLQFPDSPPNHSQEVHVEPPEDDDIVNEHLIFTPTKATSPGSHSLFGTPSSERSQGLPSSKNASPERRRSFSQTSDNGGLDHLLNVPTVVPAPHPQDDASIALANELNEEINEGGRYSLRKRTSAQERPFTIENMSYKRLLKGIPEAIVKNKQLERHYHHNHREDRYEEEGETQQDSYVDDGTNPEDDRWEQMDRPRQRRRVEGQGQPNEPAVPDVTRYPEILQGLPDTDEEEDKEMDAVTREARRLIKQKAKEKKAKEREERELKAREENLKAKRFPVSKRLQQSPKHKSPVDPSGANDDNEEKDEESSGHAPQPFDHTQGVRQPSNAPSSTPVSTAMREYFAQNDDLDMDDHDNPYNHDHDNPYSHDLQEDDFGWDRNSPANDRNSAPPSSIGTDHNSYELPIPVVVDEEEARNTDYENELDQSQLSRTSNEVKLDLEPKKERALRKMYPAFMIAAMVNGSGGPTKPKPQRPHEEKDSEDEGPLQVGHTRKQIAANPKDIKDIRGDSESEFSVSISSSDSSADSSSEDSDDFDKEHSDPSGSGVNNTSSGHQRRIVKTEKREVIDLTGYYSETEARPSKWPYKRQHKSNNVTRLRDSSMLDYMLAKSSRLEPKRTRRVDSVPPSRRNQPKFKHDIVTAEGRKFGREIQTTLNFHSNGGSTHRHRKSGKRKLTSSYDFDDFPDEDNDYEADGAPVSDIPADSVQRTKADRKKKFKERKEKEKYIGIHVFSGSAQQIISGRRRLSLNNVSNPENEEFQRILLPSSQNGSNQIDWSRQYYPPPLIDKRSKRRDTPSNTSNDQGPGDQSTTNARAAISSHFGIPILHPGKSFGPSTYIKKGWLYQLTTPGVDVHQPFFSASTILGFEIAADMGVEQLCSLLPNVCEGLLEYATGLPDPDFQYTRTQSLLLMRGISQLTSWYLKSSGTEEASTLRNAVQKEILQLVEQIEQTAMTFIDTPILTICWFMVDMSARLQYHSLPPSTPEGVNKPLQYSASLLMRFLLQFGIRKTMQPLLDEIDLDGTSPAVYSLELWVCLIHVLSNARNTNAEVKPPKHLFWTLLKDALTARVTELNKRTPLETSEDVWFTIFSVCTMSQFSVHGMTLSHFHLPGDWSMVSFAFKRIHLGKVPQHNGHVSAASVMLDKYVSLIVDRCYQLHKRYKWTLDDPNTYSAFNELAEIFRARKFANLVHEESEYSRFFRIADWDLLSSRAPKDSAFTVFLKLVVQAALSDKLHAAGKPSPRVKKLLSIVIPMGSLPFTECNKPQGNDLTKFYNRITALVVAADLDRSSIDERIQKARGYLDFAKADYSSRLAVIRAMKNWAVMLVHRKMNLKGFAPWIEELANALYAEIKQLPDVEPGKEDETPQVPKNLRNLVSYLLGAVRHIIQACAIHTRYPYIYFLKCLRPLLVQRKLTFKYKLFRDEFSYFMESFFQARSAALPPPPRPARQELPTADEESQESQDFGFQDDFANIDWTSLDLPSDLATPAPSKGEGDYDNEDSLRNSLNHFLSIRWQVFRGLEQYLSGKKGCSVDEMKNCNRWLLSWFGFASVDGQPSAWTSFLETIDQTLQKCPIEHWVRNVELCIMLNVLKHSPIEYLAYTDRAFGSLLNALVSGNNIVSDPKSDNMLEREYVSWVLSVDGLRHPLLSDMTIDLPARDETSGDYDFGQDEFLDLRIPLLRAVFKNLEKHVSLQLRGALEVPLDTDKYVTLCINMFSGMRNNLSRLVKPSPQFTEYHDFSSQVVDALQGNRELCERMKFWASWRP